MKQPKKLTRILKELVVNQGWDPKEHMLFNETKDAYVLFNTKNKTLKSIPK